MGWGGQGLGREEQGIQEPIKPKQTIAPPVVPTLFKESDAHFQNWIFGYFFVRQIFSDQHSEILLDASEVEFEELGLLRSVELFEIEKIGDQNFSLN